MESWNPIGWSLLIGGVLFGVIVGWAQVGDRFWLVSYTTVLAGLAILVTNLARALWRFVRSRNEMRGRLQIWLPKGS